MEFKYNVTGDERKAMVTAIGELTQIKPKYLGAPSFTYEVGHIRIDKNGTVSFDDCIASANVKRIADDLTERGFKCEGPDALTIEIPRDGMNDTAIWNLRKLVAGKAALIKRALGADNLNIEVSDEKMS